MLFFCILPWDFWFYLCKELFSTAVKSSFQFEIQTKWKYQIILFDISIVSLDKAIIIHVQKNGLTFALFYIKRGFGCIPEIFSNISQNFFRAFPKTFSNIFWNAERAIFPEILWEISQNFNEHYPHSLTFSHSVSHPCIAGFYNQLWLLPLIRD